jgi:hypothetical protein
MTPSILSLLILPGCKVQVWSGGGSVLTETQFSGSRGTLFGILAVAWVAEGRGLVIF